MDDDNDRLTFDSETDGLSSRSGTFDEPQEAYIPLKVLGKGAFGQAVLYRKPDDNSLVVWKEIDLPKVSDEEKDRSLNEVDILSLLDHINVISYFNHFFDETALYIEMEYANGGNLHEKIVAQNGTLFPEAEVMWNFYQLVSAVAHIHENGILHRDIKTLNIFLTKSGLLKLGDFGISKVLEGTAGLAETHVGTPYYMSPELIRGDKYNDRSDIWACGCVLYEMLSLKKVFDASNQLGLAYAILENSYDDIDSQYSDVTRELLQQLLEKDHTKRPGAADIICLSSMMQIGQTFNTKVREMNLNSGSARKSARSISVSVVPVISSLTSEIYWWGGGKVIPQRLEMFGQDNAGLLVSAGHNHLAVVTVEKELYTWADIQGGMSIVGQLGHGDTAMYRSPKKVEFFTGIPVQQVACGEDFSAILTEDGVLYMTGSNYWGCIGDDSEEEVLIPHKVPKFIDLGKSICQVGCGDSHVIVLTNDREVFSWGCGEYGRLGLGDEDDYTVPQQVSLPPKHSDIASIQCGRDNTFLLTSNGHLLACGNNEDNKMALNQTLRLKGKLSCTDIKFVYCKTLPTPVRALKQYKVTSVSAGKDHSAVTDITGRLITFGNNKYGQLGVGDYKKKISPCVVKGTLFGKKIVKVGCGDGFTVAVTLDNHVYSWGLGENGRLGIDPKLLGAKMCCSTPRTIFGSLHKVASLACIHWHTIILGEHEKSSRVVQKKSSSLSVDESMTQSFKLNSFDESDKPSHPGMQGNDESSVFDVSYTQKSSFDASETTPSWLKKEFDEAEMIPYPGERIKEINPGPSTDNDTTVPPWLAKELEEAEYIPQAGALTSSDKSQQDCHDGRKDTSSTHDLISTTSDSDDFNVEYMKIKIKRLEKENEELQKTVKEQETIIRSLQKEKELYAESNKKLLAMMDSLTI